MVSVRDGCENGFRSSDGSPPDCACRSRALSTSGDRTATVTSDLFEYACYDAALQRHCEPTVNVVTDSAGIGDRFGEGQYCYIRVCLLRLCPPATLRADRCYRIRGLRLLLRGVSAPDCECRDGQRRQRRLHRRGSILLYTSMLVTIVPSSDIASRPSLSNTGIAAAFA